MTLKAIIIVASALAARTAAHGILSEFYTDGNRNAGFQTEYIYRMQNGNPVPDLAAWSTESLDRGYIEPNNLRTLDINCHVNAEPGVLTAQVAAGGKVDFFWPDWPHNIGPVLTYIAACTGDCASADKSTLKWVKIDESGYDGKWAGQKLIDNNFTWTTTVPENIAAGNYVFRNEIINLHSGAESNGAQLYPQCVNIEITGSGSETPEGVLGINLYKADDPGILFDPYAETIDYPLPGPSLYGSTGSTVSPVPIVSGTPSHTTMAPTSTPGVDLSGRPSASSTARRTRTRSSSGLRTRTSGSCPTHV
ncbi:lytic polysaccharide monooxygenase auxiliary activity family 9 protein [Aspergillus affinis]|uniref:lytic polysaccharide monooxygenase auxiliary activity family 9 protein n=1 Tax=Aspergillus affinis TaxID=1070780 RepID=UPI0022FDC21F|nr:glycosyl hydrolase family 61 [Aspergillus affinis]KAI9038565.1 glycosyl hydrolase family 61 [Aspergillus affinis]